ncbi:methyltransferase domain-containing protein [bacterium]|nr:methyltransferase domain-containing protein [bacterium]
MKLPLLEFLACPLCAAPLKLTIFSSGGDWIDEAVLDCACGNRYPVIGGIPVLIEPSLRREILGREERAFWDRHPDLRPSGEAAPDDESRQDKKSAAAVWGYQWQDFHELWQDAAGEDQFYRWIAPLGPQDLQGKTLLDAGCGTGRHTLYSARHAKLVIGADLSFATRVAAKLTRDVPNAHIVQADIYRLPFRPETFDRAYSIGVIHHLPDPEAAYRNLIPKVKRGGSLTVWLYGRENNWLAACAVETVRAILTRHLPLPLLKALSFFPAAVLWLLIKLLYAPLNALAPGLSARLPYNTYFMLFYRLSFRHQWMNVFDKLNAPIANYYRHEEMQAWLDGSGLAGVRLSHTNQISWSLHGIRS